MNNTGDYLNHNHDIFIIIIIFYIVFTTIYIVINSQMVKNIKYRKWYFIGSIFCASYRLGI